MKRTFIVICMLLIFSFLTVFAQPKPVQRTKEFDKLNVFIGKWQTEGKIFPGKGIPPIETAGMHTFEWVMSKTWLMNKTEGSRVQGHGYITWDRESGKYAFIWFDNFITKPAEYHGDWMDSQTLVFNRQTISGETKAFSRITWQVISDNEIKMTREVSADDEDYRVSTEVNYKKLK
jgi:hypothetical protein